MNIVLICLCLVLAVGLILKICLMIAANERLRTRCQQEALNAQHEASTMVIEASTGALSEDVHGHGKRKLSAALDIFSQLRKNGADPSDPKLSIGEYKYFRDRYREVTRWIIDVKRLTYREPAERRPSGGGDSRW